VEMQSRATIEAEVALDEGSRANLAGSHPFSVAGCVVLFDNDRDRVRKVVASQSVPKWKNAAPAHVESILGAFESTQARALVRLFERSEDGVRRLKEAIERASGREKEVAEQAQLFLKDPSFDRGAEGLFHLMLFASVSPLLYKASVEEVVRTMPKKFIDVVHVVFTVYIDEYDAPESHLRAVRGAFARYAETERRVYESLPKIEFEFRSASLAKETDQASLILVDHLSGIIASQTIPGYRTPAGLAAASAAAWYDRLAKNPRFLILRKRIETLVPEVQAAEAAGAELVKQAKAPKADVLGEPRDRGDRP
jgi:hypothetical protein